MRHPAVAVRDRPPRAVRKRTTDDDRWMRCLDRFRPGEHRSERDERAMILRSLLGPDRFHRLDPFADQFPTAFEIGRAVVCHFFGVPSATDAKQKPASRHLIERGHQLGGLYRIALDHQTNASAQLNRFCHRGRERQRNERIHAFRVFARQFSALRKRRLARDRNVRVLRRPDRVEASVLKRLGKRTGIHRVVREEHRPANFHDRPPNMSCRSIARSGEHHARRRRDGWRSGNVIPACTRWSGTCRRRAINAPRCQQLFRWRFCGCFEGSERPAEA